MLIGIIQIVIGVIVLVISFFSGPNGAIQQTVKALWELISTILICFGILSIFISKILYHLEFLHLNSDSIDYILKKTKCNTDEKNKNSEKEPIEEIKK